MTDKSYEALLAAMREAQAAPPKTPVDEDNIMDHLMGIAKTNEVSAPSITISNTIAALKRHQETLVESKASTESLAAEADPQSADQSVAQSTDPKSPESKPESSESTAPVEGDNATEDKEDDDSANNNGTEPMEDRPQDIILKLRANRDKYGTKPLSPFTEEEHQAYNERRASRALKRLLAFQRGDEVADDEDYDQEALAFQTAELTNQTGYRLPEEVAALEEGEVPDQPKIRVPDLDYVMNENRNMTVLFCDLVNSSKYVRENPEQGVLMMRKFQYIGGTSMEAHGGRILNRMGDGFVCGFGFQLADENETLRALKAALLMLDRTHDDPNLNIRIGIHVGGVATGIEDFDCSDGIQWDEILGAIVHQTARMESVTDPNTIAVSEPIMNLLHEFFEFKFAQERQLKSFGTVPLHWVMAPKKHNTRFEVQVHKGLTPYVHRHEPMSYVQSAWDRLQTDGPQYMIIKGKAGVGKSRLVHEFMDEHRHDHTVSHHIAYCLVERNQVPFGAFLSMMSNLIGLKKSHSKKQRIKLLEKAFRNQDLQEVIPVWMHFLNINHKNTKYKLNLDCYSEEREILMRSMKNWFISPPDYLSSQANNLPHRCVLQIENFDQIDPSSLEFVEYLTKINTDDGQLMVIVNTRELSPNNENAFACIFMNEWSQADCTTLVQNIYENHNVPEQLTAHIQNRLLMRAGGNPLLLEDLAFFYIESQHSLEADAKIPLSLIEILTYRIMRLGAERNLLKQVSVFGEQVKIDLLRYHYEKKFKKTEHAKYFYHYMGLLLKDEILVRNPIQGTITFRHGLHQEACYETLHPWERPKHHAVVAESLLEFYGKNVDCASVAKHYAKATNYKKAVTYYYKAAVQAVEDHAYDEVVSLLVIGLDLLYTELNSNVTRDRQEFSMRLLLAKGYSVEGGDLPIVKANLKALFKLSNKLKKFRYKPFVFTEMGKAYLVHSQFKKTKRYGSWLVKLGDVFNDKAVLIDGYTTIGAALYYNGQMESAHKFLQLAANHALEGSYDKRHATVDPGIRALSMVLYTCVALEKKKDYDSYRSKLEVKINQYNCNELNKSYYWSSRLWIAVLHNDYQSAINDLNLIESPDNKTIHKLMRPFHKVMSYWCERGDYQNYLEKEMIFKNKKYLLPLEVKVKCDLLMRNLETSRVISMIDNHFLDSNRMKVFDVEFLMLMSSIQQNAFNDSKKASEHLELALYLAKKQKNSFAINNVVNQINKLLS